MNIINARRAKDVAVEYKNSIRRDYMENIMNKIVDHSNCGHLCFWINKSEMLYPIPKDTIKELKKLGYRVRYDFLMSWWEISWKNIKEVK